jgi:hypothetical protein
MNEPVFPAKMSQVVAVTAARHDGTRPHVNNYSLKYAGVVAYTDLVSNRMSHPGALLEISGSSGATGVVGGIAALIRARNPLFNRHQVIDRIVRTNGASCGASDVWRDNMINASAAVGGPCVQRMSGPTTVFTNGNPIAFQSAVPFTVLTVKHFSDGYVPGGSGSYAAQWSPGALVSWPPPTGAVASGAVLNGDITNVAGTFGWRTQQGYKFLPAHDGQPYVTTVSSTITDNTLPISEVRKQRILVCAASGACWNTTRAYPGFGITAFGPSLVDQPGSVTWTASVGEPAGSYSVHWEASFNGSSFSYVGSGSTYTKYVYDMEGPYTMWLRAVVTSSLMGVATSPAVSVYIHTDCGGVYIC